MVNRSLESRLAWFGLLSIIVAFPALGRGQVSARQGEPATEPPVEFTSPMILEQPLAGLIDGPIGMRKSFGDLKRFVCDDVSIAYLSVTKRKRSKKTGTVELLLEGQITVRESHDRWVYLEFEAIRGSASFGKVTTPKLDAEEEKATRYSARLQVDESTFLAKGLPDDQPVLKITVRVVDNG
jgi:hypothetical protein